MLKTVSMLPDFKYHPMCKSVKLTHLIFAHDLMIFCKGNENSVNRVMEALNHFINVTRLVANMKESSIYMEGLMIAQRKHCWPEQVSLLEPFLSSTWVVLFLQKSETSWSVIC